MMQTTLAVYIQKLNFLFAKQSHNKRNVDANDDDDDNDDVCDLS